MPGSDVALAYGVINHLVQNDYMDLEFIEEWTLGNDYHCWDACVRDAGVLRGHICGHPISSLWSRVDEGPREGPLSG